jgi:hypothetical protein
MPLRFVVESFVVSYAHWLLVVMFFVGALALPTGEAFHRSLAAVNLVAGCGIALFALYQAVGIPRGWPKTGTVLALFQREPFRFSDLGGYVRPTSLFLEPAWMGGYLAWIVAVGLGFSGGRRRLRALRFAGIFLSVLAILASVSWGAYLDLVVVLAVGLPMLVRRGQSWSSFSKPAVAATLLLALVVLSPPGRRVLRAASLRLRLLTETPISARELTPEIRDSSWVRYRNLTYTVELFSSRPLRGVGLGQYGRYAASAQEKALGNGEPWCGWVAIAAEEGVFGPLLLSGALLLVFRRARLDGPALPGGLAVPALCALAAVQQLHTGSYIDLWWWFPLSAGAVLGGSSAPMVAQTRV